VHKRLLRIQAFLLLAIVANNHAHSNQNIARSAKFVCITHTIMRMMWREKLRYVYFAVLSAVALAKEEAFTDAKALADVSAKEYIMQKLYDHEIVKFGSFKLKSGAESPVYVDMRNAISSMDLLRAVAGALHHAVGDDVVYARVCGVPYGAVPIATAVALQTQKPLITVRKEVKEYGTQKMVEGTYAPDDKILLVEDVITTGSSILETVAILENHGLVVHDIVIFLDREQGGVQRLQELGYAVHVVMKLSELLAYKTEIVF
jgi:orotate phosphoribosyltransferase